MLHPDLVQPDRRSRTRLPGTGRGETIRLVPDDDPRVHAGGVVEVDPAHAHRARGQQVAEDLDVDRVGQHRDIEVQVQHALGGFALVRHLRLGPDDVDAPDPVLGESDGDPDLAVIPEIGPDQADRVLVDVNELDLVRTHRRVEGVPVTPSRRLPLSSQTIAVDRMPWRFLRVTQSTPSRASSPDGALGDGDGRGVGFGVAIGDGVGRGVAPGPDGDGLAGGRAGPTAPVTTATIARTMAVATNSDTPSPTMR